MCNNRQVLIFCWLWLISCLTFPRFFGQWDQFQALSQYQPPIRTIYVSFLYMHLGRSRDIIHNRTIQKIFCFTFDFWKIITRWLGLWFIKYLNIFIKKSHELEYHIPHLRAFIMNYLSTGSFFREDPR